MKPNLAPVASAVAATLLVLLLTPAWPQEAEAPAPVAAPPEALAPAAPEAPPAPGEPRVSNSFFDTDLRQALGDVALQTGVTIMVDESVHGYLTLDLADAPLPRALRLMLFSGGYLYGEVEPGLWVVTAADPKAPSFRLLAETRVVPLSYLKPEDVKLLLPERYGPLLRVDSSGHRVIVEAPPELADQIQARLAELDVAPQQVMIEALVLETQAGALRDYDLEFAGEQFAGSISGGIIRYQERATTGSSTNKTPVPVPDNFILGLRWLIQKQEATLRANPRVVALDGQQAEIEVGTQQYFSILTGSAAFAYTRLEQIDATIKLVIKPRVIAATGEILCEIEPSVSDVTGTGAEGLPVITVRRAKSTLRLRDGHAVVIGGLIQEHQSRRESRIPLLSDLPLIGGLFRSTQRGQTQREIIIIIAPHLLDEEGNVTGQLLSEVLLGQQYQYAEGAGPAAMQLGQ